jgi:hypothetical protein
MQEGLREEDSEIFAKIMDNAKFLGEKHAGSKQIMNQIAFLQACKVEIL